MSEQVATGGTAGAEAAERVVDPWAIVQAAKASGEIRPVELATELGEPYAKVRRWLNGDHEPQVSDARSAYAALERIRARRREAAEAAAKAVG